MEPALTSSSPTWPSKPGWPVIGNIPDMISLGLIPFMEEAWRELGDCFEFRAGAETIKCVVHPDDVEAMLLTRRHKYIKGASYDQFRRHIGNGLISAEGQLWRRQRRIIQPSFKAGQNVRHPTYGEGMVLNTAIEDGEEIVDVFFGELGTNKRLVASLAHLELVE